MATRTEIDTFIRRMKDAFGPPYKDADGEVIATLSRKLVHVAGEILDDVCEHFILSREFKSWPMPVEILTECKKRAPRATADPILNRKQDPWDEWRCRAADRMVLCRTGIEAAEGGWLEELWNFCRRYQRIPNEKEIAALFYEAERNQRSREESFATICDDERWNLKEGKPDPTNLRRSLAGLYESMNRAANRRVENVLTWAGQ